MLEFALGCMVGVAAMRFKQNLSNWWSKASKKVEQTLDKGP